jgi:hypothetical protein
MKAALNVTAATLRRKATAADEAYRIINVIFSDAAYINFAPLPRVLERNLQNA